MNRLVMAKILGFSLLVSFCPKVSTAAIAKPVTAHIKVKDSLMVTKYKTKDCPVYCANNRYISNNSIEKAGC